MVLINKICNIFFFDRREEITNHVEKDFRFFRCGVVVYQSLNHPVKTMPAVDFCHTDQMQFIGRMVAFLFHSHGIKIDTIRNADGLFPKNITFFSEGHDGI